MEKFCESSYWHVMEHLPAPIPTPVSAPNPASILESIPTPIVASIPDPVPESQNLITNQDKSFNDEAYTDILNLHMHPDIIKATTTICSGLVQEHDKDGFSCVISMQDGIVLHTTASITTALGFPEDMWIGRSFIDFVHPSDRNTFTSQINNGLVIPNNTHSPNLQEQVLITGELLSIIVCRIRRYKDLNSGYGVTDRVVTYTPFMLKFFFKTFAEDEKVIYLVIEASPILSAFTNPHEVVTEPIPFVIKHSPNGKLDYIDPESVQYLGYLPQDIAQKDILQLYHPDDLIYLRQVYETIMREGGLKRSKPYRMKTQNGDFLKLETEWSAFVNPLSKKLEFVNAKHFIIEGPKNPDVFQTQKDEKIYETPCEEDVKAQVIRDNIVTIMNEILTQPADEPKMKMTTYCQDLSSILDAIVDEMPEPEEQIRVELQEADQNFYYVPDLEMLVDIFPNQDNLDSHINSEIPLTYKEVNNDDNLARFFDNLHITQEDINALVIYEKTSIKEVTKNSSDVDNNSSNNMEEIESISESCTIIVQSTLNECSFNGYQFLKLTESVINQHNIEMEQELLQLYRETRLCKSERDNASHESKQRMEEHLARCNAPFQPTAAGLTYVDQKQGTKRRASDVDVELKPIHRFKKPYVAPSPALCYEPSPWVPRPLYSEFKRDLNMTGVDKRVQMPTMSHSNIGTAGMQKYYFPTGSPYHVPNKTETAYRSLAFGTYDRDSKPSPWYRRSFSNRYSVLNRDLNVFGVDKQPQMPTMSHNNIGTAGMPNYYIPTDSPYCVPNRTKTVHPSITYATDHGDSNINTLYPNNIMQYQNKVQQINRNSVYSHNMPHYKYQQHQQDNHMKYKEIQKKNQNNVLPNIYQQHQQNSFGNILTQNQENYQSMTVQQFHGSSYGFSDMQKRTPQEMQKNYTPEQTLFYELMEFSTNNEESTDEGSKKKALFDHNYTNDISDRSSSFSFLYSSKFTLDAGNNKKSGAKSRTKRKNYHNSKQEVDNEINQLTYKRDLQLHKVSGKISLDAGITSSSCSEEDGSSYGQISTKKNLRQKRACKKMLTIQEEKSLLPNLTTTGDSGNYSGES